MSRAPPPTSRKYALRENPPLGKGNKESSCLDIWAQLIMEGLLDCGLIRFINSIRGFAFELAKQTPNFHEAETFGT